MTTKGMPLYAEQLEMILAVTKMLNENGNKIPIEEGFFIKVQLMENYGDGRVIGEWSDEIAPDCWEFAFVAPEAEKPKIQMHGGVLGARTIGDLGVAD